MQELFCCFPALKAVRNKQASRPDVFTQAAGLF
jgi:hypothetical protein